MKRWEGRGFSDGGVGLMMVGTLYVHAVMKFGDMSSFGERRTILRVEVVCDEMKHGTRYDGRNRLLELSFSVMHDSNSCSRKLLQLFSHIKITVLLRIFKRSGGTGYI